MTYKGNLPSKELGEILAHCIYETDHGRYICVMCDADVTSVYKHLDDCDYFVVYKWFKYILMSNSATPDRDRLASLIDSAVDNCPPDHDSILPCIVDALISAGVTFNMTADDLAYEAGFEDGQHDARLLVEAAANVSDRRTLMADGYWVSNKEMRALDAALGEEPTHRHGFTCGRCEWGRDRLRTITEYTAHVAATGHIGEEPTHG